jgi:hypothetical protein
MPKGPRGERRPADVVGAAVRVARISVGDEEDIREPEKTASAAAELGRLGGAARAKMLMAKRRKEIAKWRRRSGGRNSLSLHSPDQRLQQARGRPLRYAGAVLFVLQLRPYLQDAEMLPGNGAGHQRPALEHGRHRCADRRAGRRAEAPDHLQSEKFKLRHYPPTTPSL